MAEMHPPSVTRGPVSTFGWVTLPPPPVEAVIALSIAFLAREIVISWRGQSSLTERQP